VTDWPQLSVEAAQQLRQGRAAEAARLFERMTSLRPDHADSWFNLGYARRKARDYDGALHAYGEALARGIREPADVHINRAVILSEHLHRTAEAAEELRKAISANPAALAAWINLGGLHDDLGDSASAREAYQGALRADPGSGRVMARLAAIDIHEGEPRRAIATLRTVLAKGARSPEDVAELQFALGNALDAAGEFPSAFEAITEANRISAGLRAPRLRYDAAAQEQLIDELIAMPLTRPAGALPAGQSPIFICGMFRSGSTLVEHMLGRHCEITPGGELEFIPAMVHEELLPYPATLAGAPAAQLQRLSDRYLAAVRRLYPDAARFTDKRPDNFLHIGLIKALFPAARIVHTVRHPLDNILSTFFLYFGDDVRYSERLEDITHFYTQYRRLMNHWRERFGTDIHDVDYDSLVAEPRAEMERLVAFCGLDWDDGCLDTKSSGMVRTASNLQVRKPLHRRSSGRWRNYARELDGVRDRLAGLGLL
jgi:tetratricopeptide (TPR) repeat protein